jgi:hypothetical protein
MIHHYVMSNELLSIFMYASDGDEWQLSNQGLNQSDQHQLLVVMEVQMTISAMTMNLMMMTMTMVWEPHQQWVLLRAVALGSRKTRLIERLHQPPNVQSITLEQVLAIYSEE